MLVVTDIKVVHTDKDIFGLERMIVDPYIEYQGESFGPNSVEEATITREMVQGLRFVNPRTDEQILIAYSKDAEKAIGFPFEAFETQSGLLEKARDQADVYKTEGDKALERIKFLESMSIYEFTKYKFSKWRGHHDISIN